jgi:hypothetical protein
MSQKKFFLLLWAIILTVGISSCNLMDEGRPTCDPSIIHASGVNPSYRNPVLDLTNWSIQWWYYIEEGESAAVPADCDPESQHIRIGIRSFDEAGAIVLTPLLEDDLPGYARTYVPDLILEPGAHYYYEISWEEGYSSTTPFNTGPICERSTLLPPVNLSPPDGAVVESSAYLSWMYQGGCTPDGVEFQMSSSPDFTAPDTSRYPYNVAAHAVGGTWEPCRWYYWQVASLITAPPNDDLLFAPRLDMPLPLSDEDPLIHTSLNYLTSDFTPVRSFYVIGEGCPAPSDTPVPTPAATPSSKPIASVLQAANCRTGPSLDYPVRQVLMPGEQYPVIGRSRDGTSLVLGLVAIDDDIAWTTQSIRDLGCWVHIDLVEIITGDTNLVMIINPDPPDLVAQPTATSAPAFDCSQYATNPAACDSSNYCRWDPNVPPNGACVNK